MPRNFLFLLILPFLNFATGPELNLLHLVRIAEFTTDAFFNPIED